MQLTTCHRHFEYRLRLNLLRGASVKCNCASCHSSENRWEQLGMILFLSVAALHPVMWRVMCAMSRGRAWRVTEWRSVSRRRHLDTGTCPHPAAPAGTYLTYLTYIIVFICLSMHPIHSVSIYILKRKQFLSLTQMDSFRVDWLNIFCLVSEKELFMTRQFAVMKEVLSWLFQLSLAWQQQQRGQLQRARRPRDQRDHPPPRQAAAQAQPAAQAEVSLRLQDGLHLRARGRASIQEEQGERKWQKFW